MRNYRGGSPVLVPVLPTPTPRNRLLPLADPILKVPLGIPCSPVHPSPDRGRAARPQELQSRASGAPSPRPTLPPPARAEFGKVRPSLPRPLRPRTTHHQVPGVQGAMDAGCWRVGMRPGSTPGSHPHELTGGCCRTAAPEVFPRSAEG